MAVSYHNLFLGHILLLYHNESTVSLPSLEAEAGILPLLYFL